MPYKQIIVARKDLQMSPGKLAAQVSHASMAFLTNAMKANNKIVSDVSRGRAWQFEPPIPYGPDKEQTPKENRRPQFYKRADLHQWAKEARERGDEYFYYRPIDPNDQCGELELCDNITHIEATVKFDHGLWDEWINGTFTKVVLQAKNLNQLMKTIANAEDAGMRENRDFFIIRDNCYTELTPEEYDENGIGRVITCVGFIPMDSEKIDPITKKLHMYTA